jgi:AcrR family transcriptional regulator
LVIHHFGSKDGLRSACDEYVLEVLTRRARSAGTPNLLREYLADPDGYRLQVQYMTRAIAEDSPAAQAFVERIVSESEAMHRAGVADGSLRESSDPRALAVLNVLISLATLTMPPALARLLGHEEFGPGVLRRLALPTLELYTYGLYTDDTALRTAAKAVAEEMGES